MKIAICDDISEELKLNLSYLNEYIKGKNMEAEIVSFSHPDQLLSACEKDGFHLYLLDMIMPMMSGIQLGEVIRKFDSEAKIIYITTAPEFALDSFTAQPLSYILKPVDKHKLFHVLDLAIEKIKVDLEDTITIKTKNAVHTFPISTIAYCEYMNHNVVYAFANGEILETSTIFGNFANHIEPILKNKCFVKPHVSFVVNMRYVEKLTKQGFFLRGGAFVPISAKQYPVVRDTYLDFRLERSKWND